MNLWKITMKDLSLVKLHPLVSTFRGFFLYRKKTDRRFPTFAAHFAQQLLMAAGGDY